ncbi:hypothetical protein V8E36_001904 [Tilletia maclaganii]
MDIPLTSDALDIAFHPSPSTNILAAGLISGKVQLIDYTSALSSSQGGTGFKKTLTLRPSIKSTRALAFSSHDSGATLWSASKDRSIFGIDVGTGTVVSHWAQAHAAPPSRMITLENGTLVTGDDDGAINLWDPRLPTTAFASTSSSSASGSGSGSGLPPASKKTKLSATSKATAAATTAPGAGASTATPVRSYAHHFDWISDLLWCDHLAAPKPPGAAAGAQKGKHKDDASAATTTTLRSRLVATSGDGSLSVIDFRQGNSSAGGGGLKKKKDGSVKGVEVSEDQEDELLAIAPVKNGSKFVVGTQLGTLSVWAPTRAMLDHVDRIPGHPASVDTLCSLHDPHPTTQDDIVTRFAQDDDVLLTGSSDGLIRILQIGPPHKLLGVLADHGGGGLPVERIRRKGRWVASIGHESAIKWSDLADLLDGESEDEDEGSGVRDEVSGEEVEGRSKGRVVDDDDGDESDDAIPDDDDDDDDEEEEEAKKPDVDSDSDSDAPRPSSKKTAAPRDKAAILSKGLASGALLASVASSSAGDWDDDDDDGAKRGKKGGVRKKIRGHNQAMAKRAERAAFFSDM